MKKYVPHPSIRGHFAYELWQQMGKNKNIWLVTGDLGYKMWDRIRTDFPDRFINTGAAEQTTIDVGIGLALEGKIPFVFSITTFLLYRPFESIRNYINYEKIPVRLVGSGRDKDYSHDGISHWPLEDKQIMKIFKNIECRWPNNIKEIPQIVKRMVEVNTPWYVNLRR